MMSRRPADRLSSPFVHGKNPRDAHRRLWVNLAGAFEEAPCAACNALGAAHLGTCTPGPNSPDAIGALAYVVCAACHAQLGGESPDEVLDAIDNRVARTQAWSRPAVDFNSPDADDGDCETWDRILP